MVAAQTPTLAKIKNTASETEARALLYIAICEVCDFFNVGKNMNDTQVALTVDLILESFWYLKLEEIKYCFRRAMQREKLFDRLDGNIIIGWLKEYDAERTEEAMSLSDREAAHEGPPSPDAISWDEYVGRLRRDADSGNKEAQARLAEIEELNKRNSELLASAEQAREKEIAFLKFKYGEYIKNQNK